MNDLSERLGSARRAELEAGVDDERIIEGAFVETYYCPIECAYENPDARFLAVVGDNGPTDVEIRIPFELLEHNGWTKAQDQ